MADRLFYIDSNWLTYEQAHGLGYSLLPQNIYTFYTVDNSSVSVRQDTSDSKFYDALNLRWVNDISDLSLYHKVRSNLLYYTGNLSFKSIGYSSSFYNKSVLYILYNSVISDLDVLYNSYGITLYMCTNIIVDSNGLPLVWHDSRTGLYFDNREGRNYWTSLYDDKLVTSYNASVDERIKLYDSLNNSMFYDVHRGFIAYNDFYSYSYNGIVREIVSVCSIYDHSRLLDCYYDSYNNTYCIPNVMDEWVDSMVLNALGYYLYSNHVSKFYLGDRLLYLVGD